MLTFSIPICYFPTTVVFVDDGGDELTQLVDSLTPRLAYRLLPSAEDAISMVLAKQSEIEQLNRRYQHENMVAQDHEPTASDFVNWAAIHAEVYNSQRFADVSVIVQSQTTAGLSGLDCFRQMNNTSIMKLLLIEATDEGLAAKAQEEGLINSYLIRQQDDFNYLLRDKIHHLQQAYFQQMSISITRMLGITMPACCQDVRFASFFKQLREEQGIKEFYVADSSGSMLLLDNEGRVSCLVLKNEQDITQLCQLARAFNAPSELISQLTAGQKIPVYHQPDNLSSEWSDWATCLMPAKKLLCDQVYYYSYVAGDTLFEVRQEKIVAFKQYLDSIAVKTLLTN